MNRLSPEHAKGGYERTVKRLLDSAATIPARKGIEQWSEPFDIKRVERNIEQGGVYVFYDQADNAVGTIDCHDKDEAVWGADHTPAMYIHRLAIDPAFSDNRYGEEIIDWAVAKARDEQKEFIRLDCVVNNAKLREYYESLGFEYVRDVDYASTPSALYQLGLK